MKKVLKEIFSGVSLAAILLLFVFIVSFAWTNPTLPPPGGSGVLIAGTGANAGNVGVNVSDPDFRLDINAGSATNSGFRATGISTFVDKLGIGLSNAADVKEKVHLSNGNFLQDNPVDPTVVAGVDKLVGPTLPGQAARIAVSGRYAYVTFFNAGADQSKKFRIVDIADVENPKILGGASITGLPTCTACAAVDIAVSGRYAYVTFAGAGTNAFRIIDVSNSMNPTVVGGSGLATRMPALGAPIAVYVAGRYAYLTFGALGSEAFRIIDVSDPTNPQVVGGDNLTSVDIPVTANYGIHVSGKYAYFNLACVVSSNCTAGTHSFRVVDVSDPTTPTVVGSVVGNSSTATLPNKRFVDIYVSGSYAYISFFSVVAPETDAMGVIDISNPASPKIVGNLSYAPGVNIPTAPSLAISGAGNYAYLGYTGGGLNTLRIIDISDPTKPTAVGGDSGLMSDTPPTNAGIDVGGHYVYMSFNQPNLGGNNLTFRIINPTGIEAVSGLINSLEAGSLQVRENASINNDLNVKGSLNVGSGLLNTAGAAIGGKLFLKTIEDNPGGINIYTMNPGGSDCDTGCGNGPSSCLSAFDSGGSNISCDTPGAVRCLCAGFGS